MRLRKMVLSASLLVCAACNSENVELAYRFESGATSRYDMVASARARWNVAGQPGAGSYEVAFEVTETVESAGPESIVLVVEMVPTQVEERGLPSPGLERRSFSLELTPEGNVIEVLELDGVPAASIDQDELAFIGTYRPPLPERPIRLRDSWASTQQLDLADVFQQIATTGTLVGFRRDAQGGLARMTFVGDGLLAWIAELPQGEARLSGNAQTRGRAFFDIDGGYLRRATSSTQGDFTVRVLPADAEAPITGSLELDLELEVERAD